MKKVALITGITGQDGTYLAELLSGKGYSVIGVTRDVKVAGSKLSFLKFEITLVEWDFLSQEAIVDIVKQYRPSEVYNLAAFSSGSGMFDNPVEIAEINGIAVTRLLEAIRTVDDKARFCQASSREVFGEARTSPQSELTSAQPRSPYGAAKLYADYMIRIYRERYHLFACSAILFNHESPRRGECFVTKKITHTAAKIKLGLSNELLLGNLDTARDWGFAGDAVSAMWLMLQHDKPDDYIVATGKTHTVRQFCEYAFGYLGLNYQDYVREDMSSYRPSETAILVGDASKAKGRLNWSPKVNFNELVQMMVDADIQSLLEKNIR
ncbi:MAG: GDP-mannose 4,6-dehydratase [Methylotenera sp.]|jgi:GDPmannose 4,6-dehydratase|nr:MAG: GDP-mannose 4,6-dehydratase [Methylotenera sp.]